MSIRVAFKDGVFEPLESSESVRPGKVYTAFSDEGFATSAKQSAG